VTTNQTGAVVLELDVNFVVENAGVFEILSPPSRRFDGVDCFYQLRMSSLHRRHA
jgi:hypothetical protein